MISNMAPFRAGTLFLATMVALAGCGGGGGTVATQSSGSTCPAGVATYALFSDPMTQPPAGSVGVSPTIGSITVPQMDHVAGATLQLLPPQGGPIMAGVFVANGSSLTATIPTLQPNTVYHTSAVGVPCGPAFDFGQFTTGATSTVTVSF